MQKYSEVKVLDCESCNPICPSSFEWTDWVVTVGIWGMTEGCGLHGLKGLFFLCPLHLSLLFCFHGGAAPLSMPLLCVMSRTEDVKQYSMP